MPSSHCTPMSSHHPYAPTADMMTPAAALCGRAPETLRRWAFLTPGPRNPWWNVLPKSPLGGVQCLPPAPKLHSALKFVPPPSLGFLLSFATAPCSSMHIYSLHLGVREKPALPCSFFATRRPPISDLGTRGFFACEEQARLTRRAAVGFVSPDRVYPKCDPVNRRERLSAE